MPTARSKDCSNATAGTGLEDPPVNRGRSDTQIDERVWNFSEFRQFPTGAVRKADDRRRYDSNSVFEQRYGHSRVIAAGDLVFVSGTVGYDYEAQTISDDPAEQTRQTFRNIETALEAVDARFSDVVQIVTYYVHQEDREAIGGVLKEQLEGVHPVNAGVRAFQV